MALVTRSRLAGFLAGAWALLVFASPVAAGPPLGGIRLDDSNGQTTYLSRCSRLRKDSSIWNCYVTRLLADIEASKDPAHELPRIDRKVRAGGGYLESNCHMMMHVVGRVYARKHTVTLGNLQRYLPRSNDPGCSAGFGMGMVMTLGSEIGRLGPDGAIKLCMSAPTRFRSYTCIHTLGHAYMRLYHGQLKFGICRLRRRPIARRVLTTTTGCRSPVGTAHSAHRVRRRRRGNSAATRSAHSSGRAGTATFSSCRPSSYPRAPSASAGSAPGSQLFSAGAASARRR
jgi:hypothetical protein